MRHGLSPTSGCRMRFLTVAALGLLVGPTFADPPPAVVALQVQPTGEVVDLTPAELPHADHSASAPTPHQSPHAEGGFTLAAEVLLWRARLGDTPYALIDPLADLRPQGRVRDVQPGNKAGLRVGGRYRFEHTGWDVGVTFTHLNTSGGDEATAPLGGLVYPLLTRSGLTDRANFAAADVQLKYGVFDLEVGKSLALDEWLVLRPLAGVRFTDLDRQLTARYEGRQAIGAEVLTASRFRGAGPIAGVGGEWTFGERLRLFGGTRLGLLYGTFETGLRETNANGGRLLADVCDRFSGVVPTAGVSLGGGYRWRSVGLSAGYELTHYFNGTSRPDLSDDFAEGRAVRRRGDLSLDGVFLRLEYTY